MRISSAEPRILRSGLVHSAQNRKVDGQIYVRDLGSVS